MFRQVYAWCPLRPGQVVGPPVHGGAERGQGHGGAAQRDQARGRGVGGARGRIRQPVEVREVRLGQAQPPGLRIHLRNECCPTRTVGGGEHVGRVAAGGEQHGIQQLARGEDVAGAQASAAGTMAGHVADRGRRDGDLPVQIPGLDHHQRGHDLGDAAHRPLGIGIAAPQLLARARVGQVRAQRADTGGRRRGRGQGARGQGARGPGARGPGACARGVCGQGARGLDPAGTVPVGAALAGAAAMAAARMAPTRGGTARRAGSRMTRKVITW